MIEFNKDLDYGDTGIVYQSGMQQIMKLYEKEPERAGELAIAMIETALTGGEHSSDDYVVDIMLEQLKFLANNTKSNNEVRKQGYADKKIKKQRLDEIAELYLEGKTQDEIAKIIGVSRQTINTRLTLIRKDFKHLLDSKDDVKEMSSKVSEECKENCVKEMSSLSSVSSDVKHNININKNINNNINSQFLSDDKNLSAIAVETLDAMGCRYEIQGDYVIILDTGKKMRIERR